MKNILSLLFINVTIAAFAQCHISGPSTISVNENTKFSIEKDNAQCAECYQWSIKGKENFIENDNRANFVYVNPQKAGKLTLSLTTLTNKGTETCSKQVNVTEANKDEPSYQHVSTETKDCIINTMTYKEYKYEDGKLVLIPEQDSNDISYRWTAIFKNGSKVESKDKIAQFRYSIENPIDKINLIMSTNNCTKISVRTYQEDFWK
ncbi:hypothetical protein [Soonwooa sp.]|uniref:hypothetical protein n=1 Tax=Soonwooa sp. TaxID=1938592 RepID=UPI0026381563|nr:hypothetical protein [Soonwooa sp.]